MTLAEEGDGDYEDPGPIKNSLKGNLASATMGTFAKTSI